MILKRQWGAFYGTDLDLQLRRRGLETVILCGIATEFGVESTARDAYERGYNLVFADDAMTGASTESHINSVESIFPRLGRVRITEDSRRSAAMTHGANESLIGQPEVAFGRSAQHCCGVSRNPRLHVQHEVRRFLHQTGSRQGVIGREDVDSTRVGMWHDTAMVRNGTPIAGQSVKNRPAGESFQPL